MDDKIRDLIDQNEIQQLLRRYTEMVDQRDWKRMDQIFATDGTLDYTSSGGVAGDYRSTLEWLARALEPWPLNLHYITNFDIEIDADRARSRCSRGFRLICDENVMAKSGRAITTRQLADEYGFVDVDGRLPAGALDPGDPGPLLAPE